MHKVDVYYINVASSVGRREALERNFSDCGFSENWTLHRVEALTPDDEATKAQKSLVGMTLTANYLSHLKCLAQSAENDHHALIVEDDTVFGKETENFLNLMLSTTDESQWDVIYTDVYVGDATALPQLFKRWVRLTAKESITSIPVNDWESHFKGFAGAGSYLVNRKSKIKLMQAMRHHEEILNAYDIVMKFFATNKVLNAYIVFPFLTTISDHADVSLVSSSDRDLRETHLFHFFRKLVWIGADHRPETLEALIDKLRQFDTTTTPQTRALAAVLSPLLALQLGWD